VNTLTYKESQFMSILARSRYSDNTLQKEKKKKGIIFKSFK